MQVPGRAGFALIGDESIEFYKTPREYFEKRRRNHGDVFLGRILNKRTVFMTSNQAVQELLQDQWQNFSHGYKEFMLELFDENLALMEGDSWNCMRKSLQEVFSHESAAQGVEQAKHIIQEYFTTIDTGKPLVVYKMFKALATRISIALFLSHDIGPDDAQEISELMSTHWRGIISVPLNMKGPWSFWQSGYSKALTAKDRLLAIIAEKIKQKPSVLAAGIQSGVSEEECGLRHILLFISALIPKALAAILTSVVIELSKPENSRWKDCSDSSSLDDVVLEVQRLWPPFLGGRRVCTKECQVSGYVIPKGMSVVYCSYFANRDVRVFPEPDRFKPERWTEQNCSDRGKVWTYGGGPRECIGHHLSTVVLREVLKELLSQYTWELVPGQDFSYKYLPVCRPKQDIEAVFKRTSVEYLS